MRITAETETDRGIDGLHALARQRILQRLRQAAEALRRSPASTERACGLLRDALDRLRALELVGAEPDAAGPPAPHATFTVIATSGGQPVTEFLLIPFGDVHVERPVAGDSFAFTREHADAAVAWFGQMGRKLAVDYEHQTFDALNTRPDGLRPAAGWIGRLEVRDDGLWAVDVTWTGRAAELLRNGEYRYFSPVIYWEDEARTSFAGLGPVALTNDPAMRGVQALAARCEPAAPSGAVATTTVAPAARGPETRAASPATTAAPSGAAASTAALVAAQSEVDLLRQQLVQQRADVFVDAGLRAGKITAATRDDWRADFLRDAAQAEQRLRRAPIVLPPGRIVDSAGPDCSPPARPQRSAASPLTNTVANALIDGADLDAYERAAAAGFVRYAGRT